MDTIQLLHCQVFRTSAVPARRARPQLACQAAPSSLFAKHLLQAQQALIQVYAEQCSLQ